MTPELSLEIIWKDSDLLEIEVMASNKYFRGRTATYIEGDGEELIELGKNLLEFPKSLDQIITQEFGATKDYLLAIEESRKRTPQLGAIRDYIRFRFKCIDKHAHTAVYIILHNATYHASEREEADGKVYLEILFELAQLDNFADELIKMGRNQSGKAILRGIEV